MQSGILSQDQAVRAYLRKQQEEQERNQKIAITTAGVAGVAIAAKTGKLPFGLQGFAEKITPKALSFLLPAQKKQGMLDIMKYGLNSVFKGLKTGSSLGKNLAGLGLMTAALGAIWGTATQGGQGNMFKNVAHGAVNVIKFPLTAISGAFGLGKNHSNQP